MRNQPQTLHELVLAAAARRPQSVAVEHGGWSATYADLERESRELADELSSAGAGRGDIVVLEGVRGLPSIVAMLAILRAGAAWLPIEPEMARGRRERILDRADTVAIVRTTTNIRKPSLETRRAPTGAGNDAHPGPLDLAYVLFTSGSTGEPKGVMIDHGAIVNRLRWGAATMALASSDAVLHHASLEFDVSVWEVFAPLAAGARVVVDASPGPGELADLMARAGVTVIAVVPSQLDLLLDEGKLAATTVRRIECGAEPLSVALLARAREQLAVELWNLYGPTETCIDAPGASCAALDPTTLDVVPIGDPVAGARLQVLDAEGNAVHAGEIGELYVGGPGVARGYLGMPALTAERFAPDPSGPPGARMYRTGDLARRGPHGLEFAGRHDDQVKVRGQRVELGEVQALLDGLPGVREACVLHERHGTVDHLVAAVRLNDDGDIATVRSAADDYLSPGWRPAIIAPLDDLPRLRNGKVDRERVRARLTELAAAGPPPDGAVEREIAGLCGDLVGCTTIARDRYLVEVGLDSLLAVRLALLLRQRFGYSVGADEIVREGTVAHIATLIEGGGARPATLARIDRRTLPRRRL